MKTIQPIDYQQTQAAAVAATPPQPQPTSPELLQLATNNDLNVATIARQANKSEHPDDESGEVVIALH